VASRGGNPPTWINSRPTTQLSTKARLALGLLMFTGARRSDVVRLGWPMVRDGILNWVQHKGRNKEPVEVTIPMLPKLRSIIEATPIVGTATFLVTQYGRQFTAEGFGNKMADWCKEAGLPGLNSHSVRKAAATRMADRGAGANALMAWFGWLDIKQAELYTREAERKHLGSRECASTWNETCRKNPSPGICKRLGEGKWGEKARIINAPFERPET
jgi:integrase